MGAIPPVVPNLPMTCGPPPADRPGQHEPAVAEFREPTSPHIAQDAGEKSPC